MIKFQINDITLESQWRAIILFGRNSATYKFAFAKSLLDLVSKEKTSVSLEELAVPFSKYIVEHLKTNDKQGSSTSSKFLNSCRDFIEGKIDDGKLIEITEKLGFVNVVDAFQIVNRDIIPKPFYEKNFINGKRELIVTDNLLQLKNSFHFQNFGPETEARWKLVETAWNLKINPNLLEVNYDEDRELFFLESDLMRRVEITSVRNALNGYQKGKCFYTFKDISVVKGSPNLCAIDHFLPHLNKKLHLPANINGVWNLVLADKHINSVANKGAKVPYEKYLHRLYNRNEFFIESKHPLSETIVNQTGDTPEKRQRFLQTHYNIALQYTIQKWKSDEELEPSF